MRFQRRTLLKYQEIIELANQIHRYPLIGLDTESSGPGGADFLNLYRSSLTGISLSLRGEWSESFYVPVGHRMKNAPIPAVDVLIRSVAEHPGVVVHNAKHELYALGSGPAQYPGPRDPMRCTQVLAWLLQRGVRDGGERGFGLKDLARAHLGIEMATFKQVTGGLDFSQLDPLDHEAQAYACEDAEVALLLYNQLEPELGSLGLRDRYARELVFVSVLRSMEDNGMGLCPTTLRESLAALEEERGRVEAEWGSRFPDVGITSSKQLQQIYERGYWPTKGVPRNTQGHSTEKVWLQSHLRACAEGSLGHAAASLKLRHSKLNKLITTYGEGLIEKAWQYPDLRLHGQYLHTGTATGRLSCREPNLMQIPTRTEEGRRIRKAFKAKEGWKLLSADYSQIELRVLAHYNGKGTLYDGYRGNVDVHALTAAQIYGVSVASVTPAQRDVGKTVNFAVIYGAGPKKLARTIQSTEDEAKRILARFDETQPENKATLKRAVKAAEQRGYVRTLGGRIRRGTFEARALYERLRDTGHTWEDSPRLREAWLKAGEMDRKMANTPIQGSARDIVVEGMIRLYSESGLDHDRCKIVAQIHDDLVCEVREDYVPQAMALIRSALEGAWPSMRVPTPVDPKVGDCWADLK